MTSTGTLQRLKGLGPAKAKLFEKLGISTLTDLLHYYPRTYQDRRPDEKPNDYNSNSLTVFKGRVLRTQEIPARSVLIFKAFLENEQGRQIECTWFKKRSFGRFRFDPFGPMKKDFKLNAEVWVIGRQEDRNNFFGNKITVEEYYPAADPLSALHAGRLTPIYSLTEGLTNKQFRLFMHEALQTEALQTEPEILPPALLAKRKLLGSTQALRGIHFPAGLAELDAAKARLAYEEFLLLATAWGIKRTQTKILEKGYSYEIKRTLLTPLRQNLGFQFTNSQKHVINEIFRDLQSPRPMNRLLQGDVGSGKTVVALCAMLLAAENGYQAALMAPTEILAEQHFITFEKMLKALGVKTAILTSSTKAAAKRKILKELQDGTIQIIVGTHSLIQEDVKFANLRLAVIDEQHRFGVRQRAQLKEKTAKLDLLTMTATPIPRTLALAFYGDLEVSTLTELPPGRQPIQTEAATEKLAFMRVTDEVAKGRQAYIVYPLIEESEKISAKAVSEEFEKLKTVFPQFRLAMLHGQMTQEEKEAVMADFAAHKTDILIATPVIEVGIDVKNATVMVIENAERFGLASLHQLRGRVGRGEHASYCILVAEHAGSIAKERVDIICRTCDGFKIGERDMQLRGPGEILGTRQSGELEFKAGDFFKDRDILTWAIEDRDELLTQDPALVQPAHRLFKQRLIQLYEKNWHLIDLS
ncbi:MAG: ATP-dependent DNA helicase RecG [Elusimicrobiaceae bacterium]|uniref:ATP-dependent DNA helicase RecG n=2 Tax=Candidatus Avelusimicrobium faecicola TaxID=3416205 RepID=UPI002A7D822F|nr:ATP-dependent DNA helicase RecG [Spirochaetota bacterium]MDY2939686.1 ATP-dependent DNA helicase RecG [Elusimicrobiaceae bacterium]